MEEGRQLALPIVPTVCRFAAACFLGCEIAYLSPHIELFLFAVCSSLSLCVQLIDLPPMSHSPSFAKLLSFWGGHFLFV